ncbi:hypothetical protein O0I10_010230 [Lichtheimia ornata]|uniref:NodB homology domain-containing protein n=1 Tax=Lichtheimia ornata TaxID=688661 RepID=A0AAD7XRJ6_9FUNG|nr:uncharacterized protein O0I10_010230 [Lichtheimia ornata]KAJ8654154.1 hypothetical protein O0I10_010230 [Lichtheimia ornata]
MTVFTKLCLIATLALSLANAQQESSSSSASADAPAPSASASAAAPSGGGGFQFKETYPTDGSVPTPKPEWMELLKNANITDAPVQKSNGENGPQQSGNGDPFCDWTFTGCTREDDITACPTGQWGITYDDGPTEFSPPLYDFLQKSNQKATFFMIGGQVLKFPKYVERIHNEGHELAIHTWSHSYLTTLTTEQIVAELKYTELAIKEVTGVSPRFFRPPYGDIDDRVRGIAKALGFVPVIWNHDTDDWMIQESQGFNPQWIDGNATEWAKQNTTQGGISLEHDLYKQTVDAAIRILPTLQDAYKVTTVGACVGQPSYKEGNATSPAASGSSSGAVPSASGGSSSPSDGSQAGEEGAAAVHMAGTTAIVTAMAFGALYLIA